MNFSFKKTITLLSIFAIFSVANVGCGLLDPCNDVNCQNGGICNDGTCACDEGYEGTLCETEIRAQFLGTYDVEETCAAYPGALFNWNLNITRSSSGNLAVALDNLYDAGVACVGQINGNTITIHAQDLGLNGVKISGTGSINGNSLSMTYTLTGNVSDVCNITATKI